MEALFFATLIYLACGFATGAFMAINVHGHDPAISGCTGCLVHCTIWSIAIAGSLFLWPLVWVVYVWSENT